MKKLNKVFFVSIFIFLASFTAFTGCKTMPAGNPVDPVNLLDEKSGFYLAIPKDADSQLIERIIERHIPGLTDKNVKMICDRTSKIYCGIKRSRKGTEIQSAIEGTIPTRLIPGLLTKKSGWEIKDFVSNNSVVPHTIYSANGVDVSFPAGNIACVGRDIDYMLNKHDLLAYTPSDILNLEDDYHSDLPRDIYDYLKGAENEIRFYANQPQSFLTVLTGANLDLKLIDVKGSFSVDSEHSDQYVLNIYFNFKENKFLKAGKSLLSLTFGLSSSQTEQVGRTGLEVKNILLNKEQLYKILVL